MTADDLARRLVESPHWRWMPRMRAVTEDHQAATVLHVDEYEHALMAWPDEEGCIQQEWDAEPCAPDWLPDLSDPATEGCLLRLAREAWAAAGWEGLELHTVGEGVAVVFVQHIERSGWQSFRAPSPSEALAHAILAAPEVTDGR